MRKQEQASYWLNKALNLERLEIPQAETWEELDKLIQKAHRYYAKAQRLAS